MKASVIIPTHNRAKVLATCLDSLVGQSVPVDTFEVVVVDNGSTDGTPEIVASYYDKLQLRYLFEPVPGLHVGRHAGMRHAKTDILMFADDDIVANPHWVESVAEGFNQPDIALVGGNNLPLFEQPPPNWLQQWWQRPIYKGRALGYLSILDFGQGIFEMDPGYVWGCNFSIRKQVLLDAGGFHPDAVPSDRLRWRGDGETHVSDVIRRCRLRALFHSGASVGHRVPVNRMTKEYFIQRSYAQGISDSFTDLRRSGRSRSSFVDRSRRRLRDVRAWLRAVHGRNIGSFRSHSLRDVTLATLDGHRKGYNFHQQEAASDPELLAWILKEKYF